MRQGPTRPARGEGAELRLEPGHLHQEPLQVPVERGARAEDLRTEQLVVAGHERLTGASHLVGARRVADLLPGGEELRNDVDLLDRSCCRRTAARSVGAADPEHQQKGRAEGTPASRAILHASWLTTWRGPGRQVTRRPLLVLTAEWGR